MRKNLMLSVAMAAAMLLCHTALAQNYPSKPIRLIVGFTPGGGVDINARLLGAKLSEYLGQQVIVDNRPGAGTNIANELVAKSAPDGYTLLMSTATVAINMALYKKLNYDTLRDFAAVSQFSASPNILVVNASVPVTSVAQLVARAARSPDVRQRLLDQGAEPVGNTPEEFSRQLRAEVATWAEVVKTSGAKADE